MDAERIARLAEVFGMLHEALDQEHEAVRQLDQSRMAELDARIGELLEEKRGLLAALAPPAGE